MNSFYPLYKFSCLCFVLSLLTTITHAQADRHYRYQFSVQTDNDSYAFTGGDRYYSNGLFFSMRKAAENEKNQKAAKKIYGFELGQEIFMPYTSLRGFYTEELIDRPYAGFFYLKGNLDLHYHNESSLALEASLGLIGPSTKVEQIQSWTHEAFGYYHPQGWDHQINNSWGVNVAGGYNKVILKNSGNRFFDLSFKGKAQLGTFFTGAAIGTMLRLGNLETMYNSALFNAKVSGNQEGKLNAHGVEWAFYFKPMLNYSAYNATIQGNLFGESTGPVIIKAPQPLIFSQQTGFMFTKNRWGIDLSHTFKTKETKNALASEQYGSFKLLYYFN